jgi:hypothetical protein
MVSKRLLLATSKAYAECNRDDDRHGRSLHIPPTVSAKTPAQDKRNLLVTLPNGLAVLR